MTNRSVNRSAIGSISMVCTERYTSYPECRESGVEWLGEIPAHWICLSMARVTRSRCDGPFGSGLKSQHYSVDGVRVIRLQNIGGPEFLNSDQVFVDESHADVLGDHSVLQGDLLIAGLGDDAHPVGRACVAPEGLDRAMVKADCFRFRLDPEKIVPEFAAYQLSANALAASGYLATGSTRSRMNLSTTAARKIALPPVAEQHDIVSFLNRETAKFDALVAKKERLTKLLQEKRTALITRAVSRGLGPDVPMKDSGVEWLGEIPAHWEVTRLKQVADKIGSGNTPAGGAQRYVADGVMLFRSQNVQFGGLELADVAYIDAATDADMANSRVCEEDVLLNITGASLGRCCVARLVGLDANVNQHVCIIRTDRRQCYPAFLAYSFESHALQDQIFNNENGVSRDALNFEQVGTLVFVKPAMDDQRAIAIFLDHVTDEIDTLISKVHCAIDRLKELRIALISAAVTGKIDVREAVP